jgi:hypothetical protein
MPIPRPAKDEEQGKFMSRCVGFMHGENAKKPDGEKWKNDQMVAICFSQWKRKGMSKAEIEDDERESDEEFVKRFLNRYPQYRKYFEGETIEE